ncbi:Rv3235 family protein [Gordonia paraffinivorans]|uniref:Rv3235 family protein n=1 Tax=Gordonia paraffinivorans TaxID=175628 RepID=UPI001447C55E|nr:Rv3235 family protein [Gordonia paraffinivorans]
MPQGAIAANRTRTAAVEAHRFAVSTMRAVFEVIDRRRGSAQLGGAAAPDVIDQVDAVVRHDAFGIVGSGTAPTTQQSGCTRIQRVHAQLCDVSAAEIFGTCLIGERIRVFAGRVERKPVRVRAPGPRTPAVGGRGALERAEYRWQLVSLEFC